MSFRNSNDLRKNIKLWLHKQQHKCMMISALPMWLYRYCWWSFHCLKHVEVTKDQGMAEDTLRDSTLFRVSLSINGETQPMRTWGPSMLVHPMWMDEAPAKPDSSNISPLPWRGNHVSWRISVQKPPWNIQSIPLDDQPKTSAAGVAAASLAAAGVATYDVAASAQENTGATVVPSSSDSTVFSAAN